MEFSRQFRHVLRKLAHSPMFAIISVVTLALAIGANAAVFGVVNGVLLEPLPFDEPEGLVGIWYTAPGLGFDLINQSPALHFTFMDEMRAFESVGMWDNNSATITGLEEPEEVEVMMVTYTTFPILRIETTIGRIFSAEDDSPDAPETVILSHGYWQTHLGGDPGVLGDTLVVNGRPRQIIGVMPADLQFLDFDPAIYLPFQFDRAEVFFGNFSYQAVGRLAPGVTIEQANEDVVRMVPMTLEKFPQGITGEMLEQARFDARVRPLKEDVVGDVGTMLWVLLGTVGMVLLIACANVANLYLVRAEERQVEVAVRTAMGASRATLARDFLLESLTLGIIGGVLGLGLAFAGLRLLQYLGPQGLPRLDEIGIDPEVLLFTLGLSLLAGFLFGLVPVLKYGKNLTGALKEGGRGGSAGKQRHRARNTLVVAQMALALVLLVGSGLMIRSFVALRSVHPGFGRPEEVLTVRISIPSAEIEDPAQVALAIEQIQQNLAEIPGVISVGGSSSITMDGWDSNDAIDVEGFPVPDRQIPPIRRFKWVSPGYFETMENPLVAGRALSWSDIHTKANVLMVTQNLALEYWDSPADALGKRVRLPALEGLTEEQPWREIIGVVGDVRDDGVDQEATKTVYWPILQQSFWDEEVRAQRTVKYAIRSTRLGEAGFLDNVREAVWSVNPNLPLANVMTLQEIFDRSMARTSFALVMLGIAACAAMLLGAVGIYGVTSYVVSQRRREIGVRIALGAQQKDVSRMVLRQALLLAAAGVLVGLLAAYGLTRLMTALLFGVSAVDPLTYAAVGVGIAALAMLSSYLPARRAARVDPIEALRWK
jgi:predicted permease